MRKIILLDWMCWVFPKNKHQFAFLKKSGVELKRIEPGKVGRGMRVFEMPLPETADPYHKGFNLRNMIKVAMAREINWYGNNKAMEVKWIKRTMAIIDWCFKTFKEENPDYIMIEGGLTYYARACAEVAREMGIGIITIENSFIKDKIFIDFDTGFIVNRHLFARCSQDWLDTRVLTPEREKEVDEIIKKVFESLNYPTPSERKLPTLKYDKTIFVPLQVYADQVTLYDSQFNNETFIKRVFELAETEFKDWNVILKCHPKEDKYHHRKWGQTGKWLEKQKKPQNVVIVSGFKDQTINTQELIKRADLVFVNTSQCGLEACLLEKPVVVFGDAYFSQKGFTLEYSNSLNWKKVKENPEYIINVNQMKLWFLYFYRFLYNRHFVKRDRIRIRRRLGV